MTWGLEILALLAVIMAGWLRAAGSAVTQIPRADAHHDAAEGTRGARRLANLLDDRPRIVTSVGIIASALLVIAATLAVVGAEERWTGLWMMLVIVAVVGVGDILPRLVGRSRPRRIAYRSSALLDAAVRLAGWAPERTVDDNGNGNGNGNGDLGEVVDEDELALISSVLTFSETIVREVMVPRPDMVTLNVGAGVLEMAKAAVEHGFSRFPVMEGDEVVGQLLVKDLLPGLAGRTQPVTARDLVRPPVFVPEVKQIAELLSEMRASKLHMAIVVDEFGEIAGLVTIEDLLEELVGEIADETDDDETWVEPLADGVWRVDARLAVEDLAELLSLDLPEGDWDTVGGLVLGLAERVPEEDESFEVEKASLSVARMQGRRVAEVIVRTGVGAGRATS